MNSINGSSLDASQDFVGALLESIEIKSRAEFHAWVQGKLQEIIPHEVMIAAWGDFSLGIIYYEIISALPDAHTNLMQEKDMPLFLKRLYNYWMSKDRSSSQLMSDQGVIRCRDIEDGPLKSSMKNMKTAFIHAIKDVRGGSDSFCVLLSSNTDIDPRRRKTFQQLLPYIDAALRQIDLLPALSLATDKNETFVVESKSSPENEFQLSKRESEIMDLVCLGKTNIEIGMILDISSFTVKNHMKRIFKKLDVVNRCQSVAKIRGQLASF